MKGLKEAEKNLSGVEVLAAVPFKLDIAAVMKRMHFHNSSPDFEKEAHELMYAVVETARPRAVYKKSHIGGRTRNSLEIDGTRFSSHLLRINLDRADAVYPFAATCGKELDTLQVPQEDTRRRYCLETLKKMVLASALEYLMDHIAGSCRLDYLFSLSPGEFQSWPLVNQKSVCALLGDVKKLIGVRLAEDGSPDPVNSTSGLFYYCETQFENCQLCAREPCMMRRVQFDPELVRRLGLTPHTLCAR